MAEETQSDSVEQDGKEETAPCYEDFAISNPFVRPWMVPYLPSGSRLRDFVVACVGGIICLAAGILIYETTSNEFLTVAVALGGAGYFQYDAMWRTLLAGMNYGKAKKIARQQQSVPRGQRNL